MSITKFAQLQCDSPAPNGFARLDLQLVASWTAVALLLIALLWSAIFSKLDSDRKSLEETAGRQAVSISRAYAQYLTRTIGQLSQLSKQIKYSWEKSRGMASFEEMSRKGLFDVPQFASVAIYDTEGKPVTTSIPMRRPFTVADRGYFKFHKTHREDLMLIGQPVIGRMSGKKIIQITRRLEQDDGRFAGVLVIGIVPDYFTLFSDDPILGKGGILAFVGEDGIERMSKLSREQVDSSTLRAMPVGEGNGVGNVRPGPHLFSDGKIRFAATEKIAGYPFYAMVGLSRDDVLLPYERNRAMYMRIGFASTAIILLFAFAAALMSLRLVWRRQQTAAIRETYRIATEGGNEGFYIIMPRHDRDGFIEDFEIVDCNEKGAEFFGVSRDRFIGSTVSAFCFDEHFEQSMQAYRSAMQSGFYEDDYRVPPGSPMQVEWLKRKFVRSENGLAVTLRDISEPKRHEREMSRLATEDGVTGLPNRHWLMTYLPKALAQSQANDTMLAILFIDLDDFKNVNDTLGHSAGDQLLREVATRLRAALRSTDKVVRIGGDEFTVVLESIHHEENVANIALTINQALQQPFDLVRNTGLHKSRIGASIGISMFPRDGRDVETLIKNADIAMYAAKNSAKGSFRFYDQHLYDKIKLRLDTEQELLQAIRDGQFVVHYQPRVDTYSGSMIGMEALVRWQHPSRGLLAPQHFIGLAEENGMINAIGEIVLTTVCAQLSGWRQQGIDLVPVSVNVSAHQFNENKIREQIASRLEQYAIPPAMLEIELTESAMMHNAGDIFDQISAINAMGIRIHVDDFGTGYSSLSLLQQLDMDVLKIDRAFTAQLGVSRDGEIFFSAIVSMAKALGMRVVAEGVETTAQLHILQTLSCDEVQGYYVARPLPAEDITRLMGQRTLFH
ncbi:MAG TPA: EAL domain-containing protein [Oxalicibacterium sp.]|nr:EAL domain-containing protein [Oxalicibacterium sp.]